MPRSDYPAAIPNLNTGIRDGDDAGDETPGSVAEGLLALALNRAGEEIEAICAELGITPSGDYDTVAERASGLVARRRGGRLIDVDFLSTPTTSADPIRTEIAGTGANVVELEAEQGAPGLLTMTTGTTATGRAAFRSTSLVSVKFGGGKWVFETRLRINALSTAAERYALRAGFLDSTTGDSTDGVYFEYDESVSANWRLKTANNAARTALDSGVAVAAGAWLTLRVEVNAAGNEARYFINGVEVAPGAGYPLTTNIPTGVGRACGVGAMMLKSVGLTARTVDADYLIVDAFLSAAR